MGRMMERKQCGKEDVAFRKQRRVSTVEFPFYSLALVYSLCDSPIQTYIYIYMLVHVQFCRYTYLCLYIYIYRERERERTRERE